ncbi:molybdopterin converting factor subunit 1 [Ectobacillus ponti]|uniref:Molybdopterin synthase sulfur carrier subunit n=1 Tax=Ectobacillus ponti TaxID=2961894 RepID=A0AA41X2Q2_9BACI|nr:molybdopterin converting factor subunit 1 [Ectobacillus ponti]MCP8967532.1 molybdopterin converting factor subunit 1 [Ectobacillus ponti]
MITVLVFAHLKEKFGQPRLVLEEQELTVSQLRRVLAEQYDLQDNSVMIAVNEEFAEEDEVIRAGDTVALIPPVSGG